MDKVKSGNLQSIQFLRGIAATMVMLHHLSDLNIVPESNPLVHIMTYGWMGVNVFFIISGFILPYSMFAKDYKLSDFGSFFMRRIIRIEPPYIISIVLLLLLAWSTTLSSFYKGPAFTIDWGNVLGHIAYVNAFTHSPWLNLAYWTLAIEFEFYIMLAVLYPLITHENKLVLVTTYLALLCATFIPTGTSHILHYLPFFLTGINLFLYKTGKIPVYYFIPLLLVTSAVCYFVFGPILFCISLAVLPCILYIRKVPKFFLFLGLISYSLYLTHGVLISRIVALSKRFAGKINGWPLFLLCAAICIGFAAMYYFTIEKFFLNLSKRVKYNHGKARNPEHSRPKLLLYGKPRSESRFFKGPVYPDTVAA